MNLAAPGEQLSGAQLQHELMAFIRAFGLLSEDTTPCGQPLAPSTAHALTEIAAGPVSQRDLAERLNLERSSVSRLVDRLVTRGWVIRAADASDRRVTELTVTRAGAQAAESLAAARSSRFAALLDAVPPDRRHEVLDVLRLLIKATRAIGES